MRKNPKTQVIDALQNEGEWLTPSSPPEWLTNYACDCQVLTSTQPFAVFKPRNEQAIRRFAQLCYEREQPYTARCGGTGLAGGAIPAQGGMVLLTGHLQAVVDYDPKNGKIVVEPGITPDGLNAQVEKEGWEFPLYMESGGVAGLAGSLVTQAMRLQKCLPLVESVEMVDGQGKLLEVPSTLIAGTEGIFGTITKIALRLQPKRARKKLLVDNPVPKEGVRNIRWNGDNLFEVTWEGEPWRIPPLGKEGELPSIWSKIPRGSLHAVISSTVPTEKMGRCAKMARDLAAQLKLRPEVEGDFVTRELLILLLGPHELFTFRRQIESFCEAWVNILSKHDGCLTGQCGVGKAFTPFQTPFWGESFVEYLKKMKRKFDPRSLISPEHLFPVPGHCVEKLWITN